MQSIDLNAGGSASFSFDNPGDAVTGRVVNLEELQQTDLQTGQPKTFDNGQPMMMYRVELQTQQRADAEDDGVRSVYLKGSKKPESQSSLAAVLAAVKAATGRFNLTVGGTLTLTYVGDGVAKNRGFNAPKLYSAQYIAPSVDLGGDAAQPQAVPVQQPIYPAPPQQPAQPAYQPPAAQPVQPPAPQVPAAAGPTPEQVAAVRAAGLNPAAVFPGYQG